MVGDGSYLMMNSEIASAVMLGLKLTIVVLDNRGYGHQPAAADRRGFNNTPRAHAAHDAAGHRFRRPCGESRRTRRKVDSLAQLEEALSRPHRRPHLRHRRRYRPPRRPMRAATGGTSRFRGLDPQRGQCGAAAIRGSAGAPAHRCRATSVQHERHAMIRIGPIPSAGRTTTCASSAARRRSNLPGGSQGGRVRGDGTRTQVPRERDALKEALAPFRTGLRLRLVLGGAPRPFPRRRDGGAAPASRPPQGDGIGRPRLRRDFNAVHGDRSKPVSPRPVLKPGDWPEFGRRVTQVAERTLAEGVRLVYHHHMGTIVESRPTSTPS